MKLVTIMKGKFKEILLTLKALSYQVKCKMMNAKYYGVPQSRERLIFIGVRNDLGIEPSYPVPNNNIVTFGQIMQTGLSCDLDKIGLERWKIIPQGGNWQNLPKRLINGKAKFSNFHRKLHPKLPSYTLGKEEHFSSGRFYHPVEPRRISDIELKRIGSFPDDFIFCGTSKDIHKRIGNSVPPKFMQAIAENIKVNILDKYYNKIS